MPAQPSRARKSATTGKRPRGRPPLPAKSNPPVVAKPAANKSFGNKRQRQVAPDPDEDELQDESGTTSLHRPLKRQRSAHANHDRNHSADESTMSARSLSKPRVKFPHLKPQTRNVPKSTIASKWKAAPIPAQQAARNLLVNAKRAVMLDRHDNKRRTEAEINLASVLRNLEKKLPRVPFPPRTGESHFDLDKVMEHNRALENDLTPAIHAVELLEAAVEEERDRLHEDGQRLAKLEEDARKEENFQRRAFKMHPLLKGPHAAASDGPDHISLVAPRDLEDQGRTDWVHDEDVEPLLGQLRDHVSSLKTNTAQVDGLDEAMGDGYAAVDGALTKYAACDTLG
ncbi:CENP-Q, a CENPA-CAD centromere complex subunit-domain-containing protein [Phyllosticta citribraziliensis]|uniref:CENP-Q, a CENPA-CAD centromere complex subunit-domain-containing protein n=1 Tax=Phyllosticta citribraziliensis TaxID=989973 RepID=A0ABR1LFI1_9PEZI